MFSKNTYLTVLGINLNNVFTFMLKTCQWENKIIKKKQETENKFIMLHIFVSQVNLNVIYTLT